MFHRIKWVKVKWIRRKGISDWLRHSHRRDKIVRNTFWIHSKYVENHCEPARCYCICVWHSVKGSTGDLLAYMCVCQGEAIQICVHMCACILTQQDSPHIAESPEGSCLSHTERKRRHGNQRKQGNLDTAPQHLPHCQGMGGGWGCLCVGAEEVHSPDPNMWPAALNMAPHSCFHVFIAHCQEAKVALLRSRSPHCDVTCGCCSWPSVLMCAGVWGAFLSSVNRSHTNIADLPFTNYVEKTGHHVFVYKSNVWVLPLSNICFYDIVSQKLKLGKNKGLHTPNLVPSDLVSLFWCYIVLYHLFSNLCSSIFVPLTPVCNLR